MTRCGRTRLSAYGDAGRDGHALGGWSTAMALVEEAEGVPPRQARARLAPPGSVE